MNKAASHTPAQERVWTYCLSVLQGTEEWSCFVIFLNGIDGGVSDSVLNAISTAIRVTVFTCLKNHWATLHGLQQPVRDQFLSLAGLVICEPQLVPGRWSGHPWGSGLHFLWLMLLSIVLCTCLAIISFLMSVSLVDWLVGCQSASRHLLSLNYVPGPWFLNAIDDSVSDSVFNTTSAAGVTAHRVLWWHSHWGSNR